MGVVNITDADLAKSRADLDRLKAHSKLLREMQSEVAQNRKAIYDAHIEAGFSEAQALWFARG